MLIKTAIIAATFTLAACGYVSEYERQVYDYDPVYCYQSIGSVQCYQQPKASDESRLVNYYGPAPSRYDRSEQAETPDLQPPTDEIEHWVKDPEPVVQAPPAQQLATVQTVSAPAPEQTGAQGTGFWEGIRRGIFGKPQLANPPKPVPASGTL